MTISPLDPAVDVEQVRELLAGRLQQTYAAYSGLVGGEPLRRFLLDRDLAVLRGGAGAFVGRDGPSVSGLAAWSHLPWDSEQFGFEAGRVDLLVAAGDYRRARQREEALLCALLESCRHRGIRHLIARVDAGDFSAIHALEAAGFETIDGIQTFSLTLGDSMVPENRNDCEVRLFRQQDLEQILTIARSSYIFDRFHADCAVPPEIADAVNETWLRNSCLGKATDSVVVAADGRQVLGYVTCKIDRETGPGLGLLFGSIVLVATAAAARGRGVGRAATFGALAWFCEQGVRVVEVGTQLRNLPAGRLYESCGFRLVRVSLTLRKLL
jgi:ribosomal protein S18 acetylase RimI-like enzyme